MSSEVHSSDDGFEGLPDIFKKQIADSLIREEMLREFGDLSFNDLIDALPPIRKAPGAAPFDAVKFDKWAAGGASSHEKILARFILKIWNHDTKWKCGEFDITDVALLDAPYRAVIMKWVANPSFP